MRHTSPCAALLLSGSLALLVPASSLRAQQEPDEDEFEDEESELAAQAQNPVAT